MNLKQLTFWASLLFTITIFLVCAYFPLPELWGINHLQFLPDLYSVIFVGLTLAAVATLFLTRNKDFSDDVINSIGEFIWSSSIWIRYLIVVTFIVIFIIGKLETFFLGDGYTLISVMGQGKVYLQRWTVPGSTYLFRWVQGFVGGYSNPSAIEAFQFLSILSGAISVYNLIGIAGLLSKDNRVRFLVLSTTSASGSLLLFFGYVEFYPMYWATATTFIYLSLRYLDTHRGFVWVLLSFVAVVLTHLQASIMTGGLLLLVLYKLFKGEKQGLAKISMRLSYAIFIAIGIAGLFSIKFLPEFFIMKFPFLTYTEDPNKYSVYGIDYLMELLNQTLLVFPCFFVLLSLGAFGKPVDAKSHFLALLGLGALGWIVVIDPTLGLGRDWDLYTIPLLLIGLFALWGVTKNLKMVSGHKILTYSICCLLITSSFLFVNIFVEPSEERFLSLVRRYEDKDYTGWSILSYYYFNRGEHEKSVQISKEMTNYFSDRGLLAEADNALSLNEIDRAIGIGTELLDKEVPNPNVFTLLAKAYKRKGMFEQSEKFYRKALRLKSHHRIANELGQLYLDSGQYPKALQMFRSIRNSNPDLTYVTEGLGLTYFRMQNYQSALAVADTLFMGDSNSAGAHLLKMVVAIETGSLDLAKFHFVEFLNYGKNRSDYESIGRHYSYLNDS